ncbi:MAG: hypothetical protein U0Z53_16095 [Blastocatellia bacterium]
MISPLVINKALRQHLSPVLLRNGFDLVKARKAWGWHPHAIYVLEVDNVGNAFSKTTGWPMHSLRAAVGLWIESAAESEVALFSDEQGRLRPDLAACRHRLQLQCTLDQSIWQSQLPDAQERGRTDIWRVQDDGGNLTEVVRNIADAFRSQAVPWLTTCEQFVKDRVRD